MGGELKEIHRERALQCERLSDIISGVALTASAERAQFADSPDGLQSCIEAAVEHLRGTATTNGDATRVFDAAWRAICRFADRSSLDRYGSYPNAGPSIRLHVEIDGAGLCCLEFGDIDPSRESMRIDDASALWEIVTGRRSDMVDVATHRIGMPTPTAASSPPPRT